MSIKQRIIQILKENRALYYAQGTSGVCVPAGKIEDIIRDERGTKGETVGRRLRELAQDNAIEKDMYILGNTDLVCYRVPFGQQHLW